MTPIAWISLVALLVATASLIWNVVNARKIREQPRRLRQVELRMSIQDSIYDLRSDLAPEAMNLESGHRVGQPTSKLRDLENLLERREGDVAGVNDYELASARQLVTQVRRGWDEALHVYKMREAAVGDLRAYRSRGETTPAGIEALEERIRYYDSARGTTERSLLEAIEGARGGLDSLRERLRSLDARD